MAQYMHLEIYKKTFEFLKYYSHLFSNFQKEYRYTIGEKLLDRIIEFIVLIYNANDAKDNEVRFKILTDMKNKLQYINIGLRLSDALHCISSEKYENSIQFVFEIEKQLSGWIKYTNEKKKNNKI